jgi:hypothetical protein
MFETGKKKRKKKETKTTVSNKQLGKNHFCFKTEVENLEKKSNRIIEFGE